MGKTLTNNTVAKDPKSLLPQLRRALGGPIPLKDKTNPLFPAGKKGKELLDLALSLGYLTVTKMPVQSPAAGKKKPQIKQVEHVVITDAGRKYVLEADDPKPLLESLESTIKNFAANQTNQNQFQEIVQKAKSEIDEHFNASFEKISLQIQKKMEALLKKEFEALEKIRLNSKAQIDSYTQSTHQSIDFQSVLENINVVLQRVKSPQPEFAPQPSGAAHSGMENDTKAIENIILNVVGSLSDPSIGIRFDLLWEEVTRKIPTLTIGQFQDSLRNLKEKNKLTLSSWNGTFDEMPKPELGLFTSTKVIYYAYPII